MCILPLCIGQAEQSSCPYPADGSVLPLCSRCVLGQVLEGAPTSAWQALHHEKDGKLPAELDGVSSQRGDFPRKRTSRFGRLVQNLQIRKRMAGGIRQLAEHAADSVSK